MRKFPQFDYTGAGGTAEGRTLPARGGPPDRAPDRERARPRDLAEKEHMPPKARPHSTDAEAVARVLDGDADAFRVLVERHRGRVSGIVARHVPRRDVEDTAQEAFIRAFQSLGGLKDPESIRSWLSTIAVRTCYDYWRRNKRNRETSFVELSPEHLEWLEGVLAQDPREGIEAAGRRAEAREILDAALARLSPGDRMVLELVHLQEMPVREAAQMLGWSAANVKVRAFRSRKKLRALIEERGEQS